MLVTESFCNILLKAATHPHSNYAQEQRNELLARAKRLQIGAWKAGIREFKEIERMATDDMNWSKAI